MRVVLLIRSLDHGGTQRQLVNLAVGLRARGHAVLVVQMFDGDHFTPELRAAGIPPVSLALRGRWDLARLVARGLTPIRRFRPSVIHGFHPESNLLGLLLGRLPPRAAVVWGFRWTDHDRMPADAAARAAHRLQRRLARLPDLVIANSHAGGAELVAADFPRHRVRVIENGIDHDLFRPDPAARRRMRNAWRLEGRRVIGVVARLAPAKDHDTFLRAAAILAARREDVGFVCVGDGAASYRLALERLARQVGLGERLLWAGAIHDMPAAYNAMDVATLVPAYGDATSNAVAEAMACGVPCVVSDVGDLARCVGDTGVVVPSGAPEALADAWETVLNGRMGLADPRSRIVEHYPVERMVGRTEEALAAVAPCPT